MSDPVRMTLLPADHPDAVTAVEASWLQRLQQIANGALILSVLLMFLGLYSTLQTRNALPGTLGVIFFILTVTAAFFRPLSYDVRAWLLVGAFTLVGIAGLSLRPFTAVGLVFLLTSVLLCAFLFSRHYWQGVLVFEAAAAILITLLHSYQLLRWENILVDDSTVVFWGSLVAVTTFLAALIGAAMVTEYAVLKHWIDDTFHRNEELTVKEEALQKRNASLEQLLDRRKYLSITARQMTRDISQQPSSEKVMQTAVDFINKQFDYYHTGIFIKDERSEFAVLKAGTGEAGDEMLARQHKLRIREEGVVGYVVARGEVRIAAEVTQDTVHYKNPSLPLTQSEMAVPLFVGDSVIGALDVQSTQPNAFDEEDVDFLQTVAATLASSIHRTTQVNVLEHELSEIKENERAASMKSWQAHLKGTSRKLSYLYNGSEVVTGNQSMSRFDPVTSEGNANSIPIPGKTDTQNQVTSVSVPIRFRDQVLGKINLKVNGQKTPAEITQLVNSASDRLALALENARLLEEIQERAEREHLVSDISDRVRAATDIDTILKTTVQELGKAMGVGEVRIQLKTRETK